MTAEKQNNLIKELLDLRLEERNTELRRSPSFLAILGRSYDEDLISRVLAYILKNDYVFAEKLINDYYEKQGKQSLGSLNITDIVVTCEKSMNSGRADIFAEIKTQNPNTVFTITIENKIYSGIHGTAEDEEQTTTYYKFVERFYRKSNNVYFLLKPAYNATVVTCKKFATITYSELVSMISVDNPRIDSGKINDFITHIKEYLCMAQMKISSVDKEVFANLSEYRAIIQSAESAICALKTWLFSKVSEEIDDVLYNYYYHYGGREEENKAWGVAKEKDGFTNDIKDDSDCCKLYRVTSWFDKGGDGRADGFWFYVEIKFENNNPYNIVVQSIIKRYGNQAYNSVVGKFIKSDEYKDLDIVVFEEGQYYIFDKQEINQQVDMNIEPFTPEWQEAIKSKAVEKVKEQIRRMDQVVDVFYKWKKAR